MAQASALAAGGSRLLEGVAPAHRAPARPVTRPRSTARRPASALATLPFAENFDNTAGHAIPAGWTILNANSDTIQWRNSAFTGGSYSAPNALTLRWTEPGTNQNDWAITPGITLTAGQSVDFSFRYRNGSAGWTDKLEVKVGTAATAAALTTQIFNDAAIANPAWQLGTGTFVAPTAGNYYFGIHAYSDPDQERILFDDVEIVATAACPAPTALGTSAIGGTTATLTFNPNGGNNFTVEYGPTGYNPATGGTNVTTTTGSVSITGLTPLTGYDFYVTRDCGAAGMSVQVGPYTFTTTCIAPTITTFPYTEGFESVPSPAFPCGVTRLDANGDGVTWKAYDRDSLNAPAGLRPHSGQNEAGYFYNTDGTTPANDWIFLPAMSTTAGTQMQVKFWWAAGFAVGQFWTESMEVKWGTAPTVAAMTNSLFSGTIADTVFQQVITSDFAAPTGSFYIGFHCNSDPDEFFLNLDDITVQQAPACPAPTALAATAITGTTATLTFNAGAGNNFTVIYGPTGFNPATAGTTVTTTTGSVNVTGLTPSTTYDFYVTRDCGAAGMSTQAGPRAFTTLCAAPTLTAPFTENFDGTSAGNLVPCGWTILNANGDTATWHVIDATVAQVGASSPPNVVRIETDPAGSDAKDDWFMSPGISMTSGLTYTLTFQTRVGQMPEDLEIKVGTTATPAGLTTSIFDATITNPVFPGLQTAQFTAPSTGVFYIGFHAKTAAGAWRIYLDDVALSAGVACAGVLPSSLTATAVTSTTATLNFAPGTGTAAFTVIYGPTGFNPATGGTSVTTTTGSVNVTGLTPSTTYDFYVVRNCGGTSGNSAATGPRTFTTQCTPPTLAAPFTENFDGTTAGNLVPCGWMILNANGDTATWHVIDAAAAQVNPASPPNVVRIETDPAGSDAKDDWFISPKVTLTAGLTYTLTFQSRVGQFPEDLEIKVGTTATPAGLTTSIFDATITNPAFPGLQTAQFTPTANGDYYIGFHAKTAAGAWRLYIDDVALSAGATCAGVLPSSLTATAVTTTTATLNFTPGTGTAAFTVIYGPTGFNPATGGTSVTTTTGSVNVTGLTPATAYDFYVVRNCGGTAGNSAASGPRTFSTQCISPVRTLPFTENFDGTTGLEVPCGWTILNLNGDTIQWRNTAFTGGSNSAPNALSIRWTNPGTDQDDWAITPGIGMTAGQGAAFSFNYRNGSANFTDKLEVMVGTAPTAAALTTRIFNDDAIANPMYQPGTGTFVAPTTGTYYFGIHTYSDADQERILVDDVAITSTMVGLNESALARQVSVFPNPTAGRATVSIQGADARRVAITVVDNVGRVVLTAPATGAATHELDLSRLARGLYTVRVQLDGNVVTKLLSVER